jgi:hypothetical protein
MSEVTPRFGGLNILIGVLPIRLEVSSQDKIHYLFLQQSVEDVLCLLLQNFGMCIHVLGVDI